MDDEKLRQLRLAHARMSRVINSLQRHSRPASYRFPLSLLERLINRLLDRVSADVEWRVGVFLFALGELEWIKRLREWIAQRRQRDKR